MKIKIFDVVELNNGNKATIIEINKNRYKVEIVDKHGKSKGKRYKKSYFFKVSMKSNIHKRQKI